MCPKKWTPENEQLLKREYVFKGSYIPELRKYFTKRAIQQKAFHMGIKIGKGFRSPIHQTPPFLLSLRDRAYIAGLFDGEGNLSNMRNSFQVRVANTNKPAIEYLLKKLVGSTCYLYHRPPYKICYIVQLQSDNKVYWFLKLLMPFLIIKRLEAERAFAQLSRKYGLIHQCFFPKTSVKSNPPISATMLPNKN